MVKKLNIKGMYPVDELNLFLILNGLKPSSTISLDPIYLDNPRVSYDFSNGRDFIVGEENFELGFDEVQSFRKNLVSQGIFFKKKCESYIPKMNIDGAQIFSKDETYFVAFEKDNLDFLVKSFQSGDDYNIGKALGYPEEDIVSFSKRHAAKKIDYFAELGKAASSNVEIPKWLGYISYIPSELDFFKSVYSKSSKAQGELFEKFTRKHNPFLAEKVDGKFKRLIDVCSKKY